MMSEELKPCPFCGSTDLGYIKLIDHSATQCLQCRAIGPNEKTDGSNDGWNRRVKYVVRKLSS